MFAAYRPAAIAFSRMAAARSAGTSSSLSTASSCGYSSRITKSRTVATMRRCSALGSKSTRSALPNAQAPAGMPGPGQRGVRGRDQLQPAGHIRAERHDPARDRINMQQHLLGGRHAARAVGEHLVQQVQTLVIMTKDSQRQREPLAEFDLTKMAQVSFGGVQRLPAG